MSQHMGMDREGKQALTQSLNYGADRGLGERATLTIGEDERLSGPLSL